MIADNTDFIAAIQDKKQISGLTHNYYKYPARFSPNFVHNFFFRSWKHQLSAEFSYTADRKNKIPMAMIFLRLSNFPNLSMMLSMDFSSL